MPLKDWVKLSLLMGLFLVVAIALVDTPVRSAPSAPQETQQIVQVAHQQSEKEIIHSTPYCDAHPDDCIPFITPGR